MTRRVLGSDHPDLLVKFEQLLTRGPGNFTTDRPRTEEGRYEVHIPNNVRDMGDAGPLPRDRSDEPHAGNSPAYAIRRLTRERPDILARVESGELSPHAAMVAAGFREKSIMRPYNPLLMSPHYLWHWGCKWHMRFTCQSVYP
jgi:hypothetical protein